MSVTRRDFLTSAAASLSTFVPGVSFGAVNIEIQAVLFDAFPIFDPRPIPSLAEDIFPGKGAELAELWRDRQFEYTWLRSLSHQYQDFWSVTESALLFAAQSLKLELTSAKRDQLMQAYLKLNAWPDVLPTLRSLKAAGIRLGFLSNFTPKMLHSCILHSGLQGSFEKVLSTDDVKTYKPDPRAYQMGVESLGLSRERILFVAFAGWDAAGAKWFGYPTLWANRRQQPVAEMGVLPDAESEDLSGVAKFVRR
jgi:2-haloacid dehalogenase